MIVNKDRNKTYNFKIYDTKLEIVTSYKYLGITVSQTGHFKLAIDELAQKAARAYYFIRKDFNFRNNTSLKVILKLFDKMVQPILPYSSEIWGLFGWKENSHPSIIPDL